MCVCVCVSERERGLEVRIASTQVQRVKCLRPSTQPCFVKYEFAPPTSECVFLHACVRAGCTSTYVSVWCVSACASEFKSASAGAMDGKKAKLQNTKVSFLLKDPSHVVPL